MRVNESDFCATRLLRAEPQQIESITADNWLHFTPAIVPLNFMGGIMNDSKPILMNHGLALSG